MIFHTEQIGSNKSFQYKMNLYFHPAQFNIIHICKKYISLKYIYEMWCCVWYRIMGAVNVFDEGDMSKNKTILYNFTILHPIAVFI